MPDITSILLAFLLGVIGGPLGGLVAAMLGARVLRHQRQAVRGGVLAFSGGFILSVVFLELLARGIADSEGWVAALVPAGLLLGAGVRWGMTHLLGVAASAHEGEGAYREQQARKLAYTLAAENLLEGLSVGAAFAADLRLGFLVGGMMVFDTFAEGLSVSTELAEGRAKQGQMLRLAVGPTPLLGVGGALGAFLGELSPLVSRRSLRYRGRDHAARRH